MNQPESADEQSRDYPVREDMAYQLKVWRFERWGWYGLVVIVLMALLGVFSRGPLSTRELHSQDGRVTLRYEIVHRNGSTNPMKIAVASGRAHSQVELALDGDLFEGFSIETLQPDPIRTVSSARGLRFWLQTDAQGQATLYLMLRGDGLGGYSSRVSIAGSSPVELTQYILP
ncbi:MULTISPECIES: hypothetical protein [Pseudomonas]|uniref:hypothetical protein n=1 Tax=Pseudomonas TaxID=286 RepID=UPI0006CDC73A|nr:hypothetical protein [Pseudomonas fuscovaginae]KPA99196.1 hypothetical protein PF70_00677 [Pseudomonas fuscovaginae]